MVRGGIVAKTSVTVDTGQFSQCWPKNVCFYPALSLSSNGPIDGLGSLARIVREPGVIKTIARRLKK
jgi:hypothetical protein